MKRICTTLAMFGLLTTHSWAAQEAVTNDGMRVLLNDDGTWQTITQGNRPETRAALTVERVEALATACRIGLRLRNHLENPIRTLVLRFTAHKEGPVAYETVTKGFSFIKPTDSQYQEVLFRGIDCRQIAQLQVHGADKCHVGEKTKYSSDAAGCLGLVHVVDSELINVYK